MLTQNIRRFRICGVVVIAILNNCYFRGILARTFDAVGRYKRKIYSIGKTTTT